MTDWWIGYPWRLIQTNLREIDMLDISAKKVVSDLLEFNANILMINSAGIIASYHTRLPFHFQSPYLTGDSLKQIIQACHSEGIRVIARTDFSKIRRQIYEQHPDWAYVSSRKQIVDYNGDIHVCINSPYQQEKMLLILEELLTTHPFDGVFFNMSGFHTYDYSGNYYGICQCMYCKEKFQELFHLPLPKEEKDSDPSYEKYCEFKSLIVSAHQHKVYDFLSSHFPDLCIANQFSAGRGFIRMESNTALGRPLPHWQYNASENTKWATTNYPNMVSSNTTVDFIDFPYRHAAVSPDQQSLRLVQSLANGGSLDYYLIGRLDNHQDRSGFENIQKIFSFHANHENEYQALTSMADIGLLKSASGNHEEYRGWFRALVENHHPFDVLDTETSLKFSWERYNLLIIPGIQYLAADLAKAIDQFVYNGGSIITTGESGFYSKTGSIRSTPVMACMGIERLLVRKDEMRSSYLQFDTSEPDENRSNTNLIYLDSPYLYADYLPGTQSYMHLIPPHNFGPPERCYYENITNYPGFVLNPHGKGTSIFIPWLPGEQFYKQGYTNTVFFMEYVIDNFSPANKIRGNLPPQVEITLFRQKKSENIVLLHLVNGSGHFGNSFYKPMPIENIILSFAFPRRPSSVRLLNSTENCDFIWQDSQIELSIPRLELFEVVVIE